MKRSRTNEETVVTKGTSGMRVVKRGAVAPEPAPASRKTVKKVIAAPKVRAAGKVAAPKAPPAKAKGKALPRTKVEVEKTFRRLQAMYPDAHCELDHRNAFELLCATVLSAQTTDVAVNKVTPGLFAKFPTAQALAAAEPADVEELVSTLGMFRQKSKNLVGLARKLVESHGGEVPRSLDALVELPGVGRKTANVVLGVAFGAPEGVVVDTHVQRIAQRLGWTDNTDAPKIEQDLCKLLPRSDWDAASHVLIFHGRRCCAALRPNCEACKVNDRCPSAFAAELVGRKAPRPRGR